MVSAWKTLWRLHRRIERRSTGLGRRRAGYVEALALVIMTAMTMAKAATQPAATPNPGRTVAESGPPRWPQNPVAPAGAPNILLVMTDDVGFGASSTFGGPVPTPTLDALAQHGLRYNQFHTTALCSPTRAALLTGRNPHNVGMGNVTNIATGYEGYHTVIPKSAGTVAEILKQRGYGTAMFGKAHVTPEWEMSQAGPFDRWPTGLGFQYFYGFLGADASMWHPNLVENTRPVELPSDDPDYHLDRDLADRAIAWIREQRALAPDKPYFVYYAPGTAHAPHHAPKAWLERFRGHFDQGWDRIREETFARQKAASVVPANAQLTPRPSSMPAWSTLSADQRRLYARLMEAYAASLAYADHQVGRVLDYLRSSGALDNTLVVYIQGDNGGSAEGGVNGLLFEQSMITRGQEDFGYMLSRIDEIGGPRVYNHFPAAWGWAMNTPFPWYKQVASQLGGIRNGLVVSWPARIRDTGGVRSQFAHVADIMPTLLEATGVEAPAVLNGVPQKPLDGISLAYTFGDPVAPSRRRTQVFEMMENYGLYHEGWFAGVLPKRNAWEVYSDIRQTEGRESKRMWTLHDLQTDFSQSRDLAKSQPEKLAGMQALFWKEAAQNSILPIHLGEGSDGKPSLTLGRRVFTYYPGIVRVPESAAPPVIGRSFSISADIVVPDGGVRGVILTHGGRFGGYGLYLHDGKPVFHYNAVGEHQYSVRGATALTPGTHRLVAAFESDAPRPKAGGTVTIRVDGQDVATGRVESTLATWISHTEGLDVGRDTVTPVSDDYTIGESRFTGELKRVVVSLD